jgi:NAD(P)-dependent dehydrogenase (short-subunit alcohol dehydrogenase family)
MQTVVVTGASSGIGAATARVLTRHGWRVFGSVRRPADGERLSEELGPNFAPLIFDVTDEAGVRAAAEEVSAALNGQTLSGLVNNAGIAVPGPLLYLRPEELRRQLDVNLVGQLVVTQAFAGLLGADRSRTGDPGRIVMMSSVGGRNGSPFIGAYNSSKFGLEGFSESLRRELMIFGIDVIIIAPGVVATPIWDKADALDPQKFAHTPYLAALVKAKELIGSGRLGFPPERIGEAVFTALTTSRPKTRYTITPTPVRQLLADVLPKRVLDRIVANRLGLKPDRSR